MQPKFEPPQGGYQAELLCPNCGNNYLHHEVVSIFERKEDEKKGLHVEISDGTVSIDNDLTDNPSARRHGLSIEFSCENCSELSILTIAQHKGNTHVDISILPKGDVD